jgi:hypothetical protein
MNLSLVVLSTALAALGCSSNLCEEAASRIEECELGTGSADTEKECEGQYECASGCVVDATCEDLAQPSSDSAYIECVRDCQEPAE